jgi:hypothetical protein
LNTTPHAPRLLLGALLASAVVLSASAARADDTPRIFPLVPTAPLPPELAGAPSALTDALVELLGGVTTDRALEDFGKKLRCDIEVSSCLDAIARALVTGRLVYGTVAPAPEGKLKVKLVRFDSAKAGSELYQRTFTLTARTPKRLGKQLARSAAQMFDRATPADAAARPEPAAKPGEKPADGRDAKPADVRATETSTETGTETIDVTEDGPETPEGAREPAPRSRVDGKPAHGRITGTTWGLIGGGALGVAVGAGFLISAHGLADQLTVAPHDTPADFLRLTEIERAGRIRTQVGATLLVAGGAALAVGAVRAYLQYRGG